MSNEIFGETLKKRPLSSFIRKLCILSGNDYVELIYWVDQGQVICIPNSATFSEVILPKLFKHNNWQSFVRQLNLYGFRKVYPLNLNSGETLDRRAVWYFKHENFQKDKPDDLYDIKRQVNKSETQEHLRQSDRDTNENNNKEIEEELHQVRQRLRQADEKSDHLLNHIKHLLQMQTNQQQVIDTLLKTVSEVVTKNSLSTEIVTETVNQISQINSANRDLLQSHSSIIKHREEVDNELEYDEFDRDIELYRNNQPRSSSLKREEEICQTRQRTSIDSITSYSSSTSRENNSFLSINSLIHNESVKEHLPKRQKN